MATLLLPALVNAPIALLLRWHHGPALSTTGTGEDATTLGITQTTGTALGNTDVRHAGTSVAIRSDVVHRRSSADLRAWQRSHPSSRCPVGSSPPAFSTGDTLSRILSCRTAASQHSTPSVALSLARWASGTENRHSLVFPFRHLGILDFRQALCC
jgi:hypothetical protein